MKTKLSFLLIVFLFPLIAFSDPNSALYDYRGGHYLKAEPKLKLLANQGNKTALFYYGVMHIYGYGKNRDVAKGLELVSKSGDKGYRPAQLFLGNYYFDKKGDAGNSVSWFKKAANQGSVKAQMFIAGAYLFGYGVKKNHEIAKRYFINAAKSGNPIAQYTLAVRFLNSKYKKNKMLGLLWLKKSADQGYVVAEYELGYRYYKGDDAPQDKSEGLLWLKKAVNKNNASAQLALGMIYLTDAALKDDKKAVTLILKSADQGNSAAQELLSKMYAKGLAVDQDNKLSEKWLKKANSQYEKEKKVSAKERMLAWLASNGKDVLIAYKLRGIWSDWKSKHVSASGVNNHSPRIIKIKNHKIFDTRFSIMDPSKIQISEITRFIGKLRYQKKKAHLSFPTYKAPLSDNYQALLKALHQKATYGRIKAQYQLGQLYEHGLGVEKDMQKAVYWYEKAVAQNYMKAEYQLGLIYLKGEGIEKNYKRALYYLENAAFKGSVYAQYVLGLIYEYGLGKKGDHHYIAKDIDSAKAMYNLASHHGHAQSQFHLAELYSSGLLGTQATVQLQRERYKKAQKLYEHALKKGIKAAQFPLTIYYSENTNPEKQKWAHSIALKAAHNGNRHAKLIVGIMYDRGLGVARNPDEAIYWYRQLQAEDNPFVQFILGTYYYKGDYLDQDHEKAIQLLTQASNRNLPYANYNLAAIKYNQTPRDDAFLPLLRKAVAQNYKKAKLQLADYYLLSTKNKNDLKRAVDIYHDMASKGYTAAHLKLGYMYEHGIYFNRNYRKAEEWYHNAAIQGDKKAQYLLAALYHVGKLGSPDIAKAKKWYLKAGKQGYIPAQIALGFIFENILHDYKKALYWYTQASNQESPKANFNLALMYEYGKGMEVDYDKAYEFYKKAAKKGFSPAEYALGTLYMQGMGVGKNTKKAVQWYRKAANHGNVDSMYQLGLMNESGVGVRMDLEKAIAYYKDAAERGNKKASAALERLNGLMDKDAKKNKSAIGAKNESMYDYMKHIAVKLSHLEPIIYGFIRKNKAKNEDLMYMKALDHLNEGKTQVSLNMLKRMIKEYPDYMPAKKTYEHLKESH